MEILLVRKREPKQTGNVTLQKKIIVNYKKKVDRMGWGGGIIFLGVNILTDTKF